MLNEIIDFNAIYARTTRDQIECRRRNNKIVRSVILRSSHYCLSTKQISVIPFNFVSNRCTNKLYTNFSLHIPFPPFDVYHFQCRETTEKALEQQQYSEMLSVLFAVCLTLPCGLFVQCLRRFGFGCRRRRRSRRLCDQQTRPS